MQTEPAWTAMPAVAAAATAGDIGTLLRVARTAAGLTLEEAGQLTGYSIATMSRMENRAAPAGRGIRDSATPARVGRVILTHGPQRG